MNKLFYFLFVIYSFQLTSQNTLKGVVLDKKTTETLIGANIVLFDNMNSINMGGTVTNIEGEFEFNNLPHNTYSLTISYIGYDSKTLNFSFNEEDNINLTIELNPDVLLDVVSIIGDQAEFRKTPVSLSNVKLEKIEKLS